MIQDPLTLKIVNFLTEIGLKVKVEKIWRKTILPGIIIKNGIIIIDEKKLFYPGDILHEAGHLAIIEKTKRTSININVGNDPSEEMMAIAWSYAAAVHLNIPLNLVFHEHGYKGESMNLMNSFSEGSCVGLPMLQYLGMAFDKKNAELEGVKSFPEMVKWLRD